MEQKATWLQIRQSRPDYVFLWGWGVMNSVALKEATQVPATAFSSTVPPAMTSPVGV